MENKNKYHFDDFTYAEYVKLISLAKEKYIFRGYSDFEREENFILWRHDVDLSLHHAHELAKIEAKEGVKSTYFLLLHSRFYGLMEDTSRRIVESILKLGHDIGIHFDSHFYGIKSEEDLKEGLELEKELFTKAFHIKPEVFSFHNTTPFTMACREWKYANLINVYASYFQDNVGYCSDSNGYWRHERLKTFLENAAHERMQILTHPGWWHETTKSPKERVESIVTDRMKETLYDYNSQLKKFNNENIDWE
ncbi:MAG: hypothetical protein ROO71_00820 [Balneola sp.]